MELGDTIKFLRNQDRKIIEFEDTLEVLRGSYSSLVDKIGNLQVLSCQESMVHVQDDWEERNISESSLAIQQRLAPVSNEILENFEDDHERKKALRRKIFYILREKDKDAELQISPSKITYGVPDWTIGGENEESGYSEEKDEEDEEDDDNENENEDSNEKRGSGGGNGDDKGSGKRLAINVIEECPNK
ncbi:hypothetical protein F8M41_020921 [Gigaspora margarita]|uniref:Uncharacterized protein n=1 Tax=Gigaspora margarita TaxID=4874 RepID=A0A8H4AHM4_GIGMA|nr:hypothetical protein F8M41_020921 [Gigaspora margarita]